MTRAPRKRVLLTGAGGFIGQRLATLLAGRSDLDVFAPGRAELDLSDAHATLRLVESLRPDVVLHLAAHTRGAAEMRARPAATVRANLDPAYGIAHCLEAGLIGRLILAHSAGAYPRPRTLTPPRDWLQPADLWAGPPAAGPYGLARRAVAALLRESAQLGGVGFLELSLPTVYGPGDGGRAVDPAQVRAIPALALRTLAAAASGAAEVRHYGSGTEQRDFLHVDDAAAAFLAAMDAPSLDVERLHVSDGRAWTLAEVGALIADAVGYRGTVGWQREAPPPEARDVVLLAPAGLGGIGFTPQRRLEDGIAEVVAELRRRLERGGGRGA
ncbi:MAG: NAD-dependent epimerase/dehydratase family protein [Deltaproteobacteria bacterium]|nr:NAD-dependent epimerase/dehydratase family protein [Deltaproteobacteria bacterium]